MRRKRNITIAATGTVASAALFLGVDGRYYYEAAERSGRVVATLYACINEWVILLHFGCLYD